ncbi:hypothetical protein TRAPUB_9705 [Trametes pubescens]|uniref:Uncharacterized protein n=1 Tax=Trametes pubescens TaxID=154538 RepID=A0A1M2W1V6_TRAPU|nr:hypothetical protein TRAPUB_9705 [Trametes pubescens]
MSAVTPSNPSRSQSPTLSACERADAPIDDDITNTSDDERTVEKLRGKQKSKARTPPVRGASRAKRMDWSVVPAVVEYLNDQHAAWLLCTSPEHRDVIRNTSTEYVISTWEFLGLTKGDVREAIKNWFRVSQERTLARF